MQILTRSRCEEQFWGESRCISCRIGWLASGAIFVPLIQTMIKFASCGISIRYTLLFADFAAGLCVLHSGVNCRDSKIPCSHHYLAETPFDTLVEWTARPRSPAQ